MEVTGIILSLLPTWDASFLHSVNKKIEELVKHKGLFTSVKIFCLLRAVGEEKITQTQLNIDRKKPYMHIVHL